MRHIVLATLVCSLAGCSCVQQEKPEPGSQAHGGEPAERHPNYYPLTKGGKWEYRLSVRGESHRATTEVKHLEVKGGRTFARLESRYPDAVSIGEVVSVDDRGIYREAALGSELPSPLRLLQYPVRAGAVWRDPIKVGKIEGILVVTVRDVAAVVEVPAGKFTTVTIDSAGEIAGEVGLITTTWYADGVGIVKLRQRRSGQPELLVELLRYTPGQ
jgi:hypothetical protein